MSGVVKEGDQVLLVLDWRRKYLIKVKSGGELHTHKGVIRHDDIIGMPYGSVIKSSTGRLFHVAKPRLIDFIEKFSRPTQIIYPKDAGQIIMYADIGPGSKVVEAGTGSGALTAVLASIVRPDGHVYSYEVNERFLREAKKNLERVGLLSYVTLKLKDVTLGIDERDVDAVILDMPTPWLVVEHARNALKGSGFFVSFNPTLNQVSKTIVKLRESGFFDIRVVEVFEREYQVDPVALRPRTLMIGHTGYILFARRGISQ